MSACFVFKVRTICTECGENLVLEGPTQQVECLACQSTIEVTAKTWKNLLSFRKMLNELHLAEGGTRNSFLSGGGEATVFVKWGSQRPLCAGCGSTLDVSTVPPGKDGVVHCTQCGLAMSTFPPPPWLLAVEPDALQLFGAVRESGPPTGVSVTVPEEGRPVSFACPDCGANLKINASSPRVLACVYCKADLYLPDPLWRTLHPVKKRMPWYVAFRS
jgi:DNA-directed RNA polymerase subunit RPC12/RpoP